MLVKRRGSQLGETIKYWTRQAWRLVGLIVGIIAVVALVAVAIKVIPMIWHWALG